MARRALLLIVLLATTALLSTCGREKPHRTVGIITTVAGNGHEGYSGDGGPATEASLNRPLDVCVGADGTLYISDSRNNRIRRVDPRGIITTVAGDGWTDERGNGRFAGDGGPSMKASLSNPDSLSLAPDGSLYIADMRNFRVRRVDGKGIITTVAGGGRKGQHGRYPYAGDGGLAVKASLSPPTSVSVGAQGSLYLSDPGNHRIRKVDRRGVITTVAGDGWRDKRNPFQGRFTGDGGPAAKASLSFPAGIAMGPDGDLYIADTNNNRIRKVSSGGTIITVAGNGRAGYSGDGGPATQASLSGPASVVVLPDGSFYIADGANHRVRKVDRVGRITSVAGDGWSKQGGLPIGRFAGDGGIATRASLSFPNAVAVGPDASLYIADTYNNRIRKVTWSYGKQ